MISPSVDGSDTPLDAVGALCAEVFRRPARLIKAHTFPISPRHRFALHAHPDLLQIDLALGSSGYWMVDGQPVTIIGSTLAVFYPMQSHAYAFDPLVAGARMLSIKLRIDPQSAVVQTRALGAVIHDLQHAEPLVHAWQRLIWAWGDVSVAPFIAALRLVEVLGMMALLQANQTHDGAPMRHDPAVEVAMHYIEQHIDRFMSLDELAAIVHLSPRHLTRRFRAACGQSPHHYANGRRLAIASDLLLHQHLSITNVAASLGFASIHSFSHWYKKQTGHPPEALRHANPAH
jgi:AraC-like DNA-binding protein